FFFRPRSRCDPANPSDDGGLEEVVEFCCRRPSLRSRSAICFSASLSCRFFSISSSRNLSLSRLSRSISRSTFRWFSAGGIDGRWRCEAPKHLHCQVFQAKARSKLQILKDLCDATFAGPELLRILGVLRCCVPLEGPTYFAKREEKVLLLIAGQIGQFVSDLRNRKELTRENEAWQVVVDSVTRVSDLA